jgi:CLIP-associating protein 1/2
VHGQLRSFRDGPAPDIPGAAEAKANTYGFGLNTLGRFILRLPDEVLEEELPRLKSTLLTVRSLLFPASHDLFLLFNYLQALNDKTHLIVRECAVEAIVAAQMVLRDQTHLFTLLDGLTDDKKDFLTYMFAKHQVSDQTDPANVSTGIPRAGSSTAGTYTGQWDNNHPGMEKLVKEMKRLDSRTSTPPRAMLRRWYAFPSFPPSVFFIPPGNSFSLGLPTPVSMLAVSIQK